MDRETFFSKPERPKTIDITLDDGRVVTARKLSQAEVETLKKRYSSDDKALEGLRYVVCRTVVDRESGERVFKDEDLQKLADSDFDVIQTIADEVVKFSGMGKDAKKP